MPKPNLRAGREMITQKPIHLTASDLTEAREGTMRSRWPRDPDTTRRLEAIRNLDLSADCPRKRFPWIAVFLIGVGVYGLYWVLTNN